jgi:hypothetical protein
MAGQWTLEALGDRLYQRPILRRRNRCHGCAAEKQTQIRQAYMIPTFPGRIDSLWLEARLATMAGQPPYGVMQLPTAGLPGWDRSRICPRMRRVPPGRFSGWKMPG